jgi:hypothetical protein
MNVFYIPWFAELISYIYKTTTSSHSKSGLLKRRLWLGFSLTSEASFMKFITYWSSRTEALPDFWTSRVPGLPNFASSQSSTCWSPGSEAPQTSKLRRSLISWILLVPNYPETDSRLANRSQIRLLLSHIVRRSAKCIKLARISSWLFPFREIELSI